MYAQVMSLARIWVLAVASFDRWYFDQAVCYRYVFASKPRLRSCPILSAIYCWPRRYCALVLSSGHLPGSVGLEMELRSRFPRPGQVAQQRGSASCDVTLDRQTTAKEGDVSTVRSIRVPWVILSLVLRTGTCSRDTAFTRRGVHFGTESRLLALTRPPCPHLGKSWYGIFALTHLCASDCVASVRQSSHAKTRSFGRKYLALDTICCRTLTLTLTPTLTNEE
jgi:hypothetical protein